MSLPNFIVHPVGLDLRLGSKELARSGCTELSAVLQVLGSLSQNTAQLQLKTSTFQQVSHSHLISSVKHIHFLLTFGTSFALLEADFHKIKEGKHQRTQRSQTK